MGRIRTVKPELFRHLPLFEAEEKYHLPLRIAFVGLFTCCDRQGRFVWQPRRLKVDILPYDDASIDDVLNALLESGFIKAYEVDGIVYGCIPTWSTHQYFNNKEHKSKLPDIQQGRILKGSVTQSMLNVHARLSEDNYLRIIQEQNTSSVYEDHAIHESADSLESPEQTSIDAVTPDNSQPPASDSSSQGTGTSREPIRVFHACATREALTGRERKGRENSKSGIIKNSRHCPVAKEDVFKIFSHWQLVMGHSQAKLDSSRDKWIRGALRMGYSVDDCYQAITGCSQTQYNMGQNDRGERYDGFHIIFKSADQIDRFMKNAVSPPQPKGKAEQRLQNNTHAAEAWLNAQPVPAGI